MNKMFKFALSAVLGAALVAPALAQDAFPDTPDNHWAYEALKNLKDKVLFGYPDGLYRGNRPMSRYEFAVAVNQLYQMMMGKMSGLEDQISSLEKMIKDMKPGEDNSAAIAELRDGLGALKGRVGTLETGHTDLKKLASTFEKELASLGVDVDAMKKDISDLDRRVKVLENMKPNVAISGDVNLLVLAGHSRDNQVAFDMDGRINGLLGGNPVGMTKDLNVLHEMALTLQSTSETGPKWKATLVNGNVFNTLGGYTGAAGGPYTAGNNDMYFHELSVTFDGNLLGKGLGVKMGRFGHQITKYVYARPDFTTYYDNDRHDNGDIIMDGVMLSFGLGGTEMNVWGGRNSSVQTFDNQQLNPFFNLGGTLTDQSMGVDLKLKLGSKGSIKAGVVVGDSNASGIANINRVYSYGGDLNYDFTDNLKFLLQYGESQFAHNSDNVLDNKNRAIDASLAYKTDKWGVKGGFKQIDKYFAAPGDYGKLGFFQNPAGITGGYGKAWFALNEKTKLWGSYEKYDGKSDDPFFGFQNGNKITQMKFGVNYNMNEAFSIMLGYQNSRFELGGPANTLRWYTVGTNWNITDKSFLSFTYQMADHQNTGANKGGLLATQFGIKF